MGFTFKINLVHDLYSNLVLVSVLAMGPNMESPKQRTKLRTPKKGKRKTTEGEDQEGEASAATLLSSPTEVAPKKKLKVDKKIKSEDKKEEQIDAEKDKKEKVALNTYRPLLH